MRTLCAGASPDGSSSPHGGRSRCWCVLHWSQDRCPRTCTRTCTSTRTSTGATCSSKDLAHLQCAKLGLEQGVLVGQLQVALHGILQVLGSGALQGGVCTVHKGHENSEHNTGGQQSADSGFTEMSVRRMTWSRMASFRLSSWVTRSRNSGAPSESVTHCCCVVVSLVLFA